MKQISFIGLDLNPQMIAEESGARRKLEIEKRQGKEQCVIYNQDSKSPSKRLSKRRNTSYMYNFKKDNEGR